LPGQVWGLFFENKMEAWSVLMGISALIYAIAMIRGIWKVKASTIHSDILGDRSDQLDAQ
jgi:uncharacterized membrane protein YqjE